MKHRKLDDFVGKKLQFYLIGDMKLSGVLGIVEKSGIIVWSEIVKEGDDEVPRAYDENVFIPTKSIILWSDDVE